jgi:hypothetical protein
LTVQDANAARTADVLGKLADELGPLRTVLEQRDRAVTVNQTNINPQPVSTADQTSRDLRQLSALGVFSR